MFIASGNSSTLSAGDNHAFQYSMDNPAAEKSLPIQMAQMEFRKKYYMIAFDQPFTIFEQTRAMSVNTPDGVRKERFMDIFMKMSTSAFVTSIFKGRLANSEPATKSIMETLRLVGDIGCDYIVKETLNFEVSPEQVTILQRHLHLVPLSLTALSTSLSSSFTSAGVRNTTRGARKEKKIAAKAKVKGKTPTPKRIC